MHIINSDSIVCPKQAAAMLAVSVTTLWRLRRTGEFPPPIRLSARRIGWRVSAIQEYLVRRQESF